VGGLPIRFELIHEVFQRTDDELVEDFAVTVRQRFASHFVGKAGCEAVVMVDACIVIPHGCQVDQAVERPHDLRKRAPV